MEKEPEGRLRWLTPEEANRLLDVCRESRNADLLDLVEFGLFTGLRQGEELSLTWDRVDRARGVILLDVTKNGRRREVPLNSRADAVLPSPAWKRRYRQGWLTPSCRSHTLSLMSRVVYRKCPLRP